MANVKFYVHYFIVLIFYSNVFAIQKDEFSLEKRGNDYDVNLPGTKLRLISMVFRHGDRTLDNDFSFMYPNNPYINHDDYPYNDGQLTQAGRRRAFLFGQLLRKWYNDFLGNIYYPPNVYARSTVLPRTKMTLQVILAALYPPIDSRQKWNENLSWQPVDTIYTSSSQDSLLFPYNCKEYRETYINILHSNAVIAEIEAFNDTIKDLSKYVGRNISGVYELSALYHILSIQASMNLSLPKWSHDVFPSGRLFDAAMLQYKLYNYNDKLIRLNGGILLYKILQDMNGVINGTLSDRKINLFSAHDVNVFAFLRALGIFDNKIPAFTSSVIVELREKNGEYFVRVLHYLGIPSVLSPVRIPNCDVLCPFEKFIRLTSATTATHEDPKCPLTIAIY
ncbi:PREDICTED: venom acid phosphatase Acph-1-like [Dinoponera quadriceps]|uniref:acid phosphatase n=1 Tax=Dinoponera quadriceps TaxID=609295 RepID=A0A6P3Y883_DINQU|nr:PREDICTED: venom acid phosphatase Acph-1-like [Dinoponera quadriceps]